MSTVVSAIETSRPTQVRWSSRVASGIFFCSSARRAAKSGGADSSIVATTRRGTGSSSMSRPDPSHGWSNRAVALLSMTSAPVTPENSSAIARACLSAASMSRPSAGLIWMVISREIWLSQVAALARIMVTAPSVRQARNDMMAITSMSALPETFAGGTIGAVGRRRGPAGRRAARRRAGLGCPARFSHRSPAVPGAGSCGARRSGP